MLSDLEISFSPLGLNHTATFPRAYRETSPPNRTDILICDLVNTEIDNSIELNPQNVTVRFLQSELVRI